MKTHSGVRLTGGLKVREIKEKKQKKLGSISSRVGSCQCDCGDFSSLKEIVVCFIHCVKYVILLRTNVQDIL